MNRQLFAGALVAAMALMLSLAASLLTNDTIVGQLLAGLAATAATLTIGGYYKKAGHDTRVRWLVAAWLTAFVGHRTMLMILRAEELNQALVAMGAYAGAIAAIGFVLLVAAWFGPWARNPVTYASLVAGLLLSVGASIVWFRAFLKYPAGSHEWLDGVGTFDNALTWIYGILMLGAVAGSVEAWNTSAVRHGPQPTHKDCSEDALQGSPSANLLMSHPQESQAARERAQMNWIPVPPRHESTGSSQAISEATPVSEDSRLHDRPTKEATVTELERSLSERLARGEITEATYNAAIAALRKE